MPGRVSHRSKNALPSRVAPRRSRRLLSGDLLVGAPGLITIPCGLLLVVWSLHGSRAPDATQPTPAAADALVCVPDSWVDTVHDEAGTIEPPTLEMPVVA